VARRTLRERLAVIPAAIAGGFARLRPFAIVLGRWVVVGAAILGLVALFRVLERHVRTSPAFAAREIQVEGTHRLSEGEVAQIAGLAIGQNVFEVAPEEARRRLLASPWIAEAEVRRRLPGRWTLTIREREPVALLALSGTGSGALERATASSFEGLFLVSDEGTVFKQLEPGDPADLPVITGIDADRFAADRNFRTRILLAIVALLSDWRASGLWRREPIAEIHVEPDDAITLRVGDDATEIRLGHGPYRPKLERLGRVLGELDRRHARPAYVYLDHVRRPDRVVVRVR
jgi:cell division protein FtsQ